ncbi:winged helix DNA-binding protein [Sphingomonas sp. LB-2]|uniref:winged helix DNA-binding protein n=1 Tax=Sphingomonas caeni TaxID=2984949 RepID=UPI0022318C5D|nr:winged helix DNA-binding protein [Sphingomonas caeni]MCW3848132.1 winged helix DNA-binding protein [Sphingomonas caeni]
MATHAPAKLRRVRRAGLQAPSTALEIVRSFLAAPAAENDPQMVSSTPLDLGSFARHLYDERRIRDGALGAELFADPMWDLMLELYASAADGEKVSVSRACAASRAPSSSALRYIKEMTAKGLVVRDECRSDARRVYVRLSDKARNAMTDLLNRMMRDRLMFGLAGR